MTPLPKVGFLYKAGRRERAEAAGPTEFFYGCPELRAAGWPTAFVDERELGLDLRSGRLGRGLSHLAYEAFGVPLTAAARLAARPALGKLGGFDVLVATTNTFGLSLAALRRLRLLRRRVLFIVMGLFDLATPPRFWRRCETLLREVELVCLSKPEKEFIERGFGGRRQVTYLPFGVDAGFWRPDAAGVTDDYVLSIGNDRHRDYATLLAAWLPEYPTLRIVTSLPVRAVAANVEILRGDWRTQAFSDAEIRDLYRRARFVVLPIRDTMQPSGQSACLQAMGCGKAVILSRIAGLWDRERMVDGSDCLLPQPGDVTALRQAVDRLLASPAEASALGTAARRQVEEHFNTRTMAGALADLLHRPVPG